MIFGEGVGDKSERTMKLIETLLQEHTGSISNMKLKREWFSNTESEVWCVVIIVTIRLSSSIWAISSCGSVEEGGLPCLYSLHICDNVIKWLN